jgi:tetratricopeptide (TPR) repeat protein
MCSRRPSISSGSNEPAAWQWPRIHKQTAKAAGRILLAAFCAGVPVFGLALVGDLLNEGQVRDAILFRDYFRESGVDCGRMFMAWGNVYLRLGRGELAGDYFKKVLLLDPGYKDATEKLKRAKEVEKASSARWPAAAGQVRRIPGHLLSELSAFYSASSYGRDLSSRCARRLTVHDP